MTTNKHTNTVIEDPLAYKGFGIGVDHHPVMHRCITLQITCSFAINKALESHDVLSGNQPGYLCHWLLITPISVPVSVNQFFF